MRMENLLVDSHNTEKMVELTFSYLLDGNNGDSPRGQYKKMGTERPLSRTKE
jgi:hypothetical protein